MPQRSFGPRFEKAIAAIDAANAEDPRRIEVDGESVPYELFYARRLTEWIERLESDPSEPLLLAARGLHLRRWTIPRDTYPRTRAGYLAWKQRLLEFHAQELRPILASCGYPPETIERVTELVLRTTFPEDPEAQTIEDAVTLLFLEHQLDDLASRTEHKKMVRILRRAWRKISPKARQFAGEMELPPHLRALVEEALNPPRP
ncbi:MAG: hypothetical protein KatS3mg115_1639 [Candidatus Poribacteria bacterium]|nr:MAG: hypothetical protein KatS3mg115_1639 [Candidatus Poribacteria bacterium]